MEEGAVFFKLRSIVRSLREGVDLLRAMEIRLRCAMTAAQ
jgi:hypothetical protein